MRKKFPSKGFALIAVLGLVTVLFILVGALMGTNRTAFSMLKVSQASDRMDRTISSVYSYCRFRLEHDYRWGKEAFAEGDPVEWGHLRVTEIASGAGDIQSVVGYDQENQCSFAVEVCNNLRTDGEVATLRDIRGGDPRQGVPVGFCRLEIKVESAGRLEGVEVMVRNPGLVGGVCLANDSLVIDAQQLDMLTRDPIKNQARSLGETRLTGLSNFLQGQSTSEADDYENDRDNISERDPVIWSGTANLFRTGEGEEYQRRDPFKRDHASIDFQDQRFVDESRSLFDIPDVELDDLTEVTFADGTPKPEQSIPAGIYRFEQVGDPPIRVMTRREAGGNLEAVDTPVEKYWWAAETGSTVTNAQVASLIGANPSVGEQHVITADASTRYISINSGGAAKVDLMNRRVVLDEAYNFEVNGDFSLIGSAPVTEGNPNGDMDLREVNPAIYFADPDQVALTSNFNVSEAANLADRSPEKGSLRAQGRINIQGDISGSTTIAARGDLTIATGRFYDAEGNSEVNFSLFSEHDVRFLPPPILEQADDRVVDDGSGTVVDTNGQSTIEAVNVSEQDIRFTGLIYARNNVFLDLQDTRSEAGTRRDLRLEGAIVAKQGQLEIHNAGDLELIYNPQFVDRLIPSVATAGQRRIEVTGWRGIHPAAFSAEIEG